MTRDPRLDLVTAVECLRRSLDAEIGRLLRQSSADNIARRVRLMEAQSAIAPMLDHLTQLAEAESRLESRQSECGAPLAEGYEDLQGEAWSPLSVGENDTPVTITRPVRRKGSRHRGWQAYRRPILRALLEHGGYGPASEVVTRAAVLGSPPGARWDGAEASLPGFVANVASVVRWCAREMALEGHISGDVDRGALEITEAGRRWLEEQEKAK